MKNSLSLLGGFLLCIFLLILFTPTALAIYDPLVVPNNRFGIHIIQATDNESSPASELVNSSGGDWGYITVLIESNSRDTNKWQNFFNDLRRRHLIPIVRLATKPEGNFWKRPYDGEEIAWADFLDNLVWPTKNRYIVVYNEPNHATEWGNSVDPVDYAKTLSKTADALKKRSDDFFVLNAGLDASAPQKMPQFMDELNFLQAMEEAVPDVFNKLDGWVSHSYPNPGFVGSPDTIGRGTVRTYFWETTQLRNLGASKIFPIFITETGWKHAEGIHYDHSLPSADQVADNYKIAFDTAWNSFRIVAITPFLLTYQDVPFDHFSFKKVTGEKQNQKILGAEYPDYYSIYKTIKDIPKQVGHPVQEYKAELTKGEIYSSMVAREVYEIPLTFKNTGQSIWNEMEQVRLSALSGAADFGLQDIELPKDKKIEPGQEYTFNLKVQAPLSGSHKVSLGLLVGNRQFDSKTVEFSSEVKSPVGLKVQASLKWKDNPAGDYLLEIAGTVGRNIEKVTLGSNGQSADLEARYLLPGYTFSFTLEKPFYRTKTIQQSVNSGENDLNFGELEPDLLNSIFNPVEFWKLLPFSR